MAARTPAPRGETGSSGAPPDHPGGAPDFFFVPLWIYTALKRLDRAPSLWGAFVPLWIYTALKRRDDAGRGGHCFVPLWIYTALKRG